MLGWIQGVNKQEQIPSCFLISSWWLSVLRSSPGWGLSDPWLIRQEDQGWPALGCRLLHCRNFMPCSACPQSLLKLPSMNSWFLPGQASRNAAEWPCSLCVTPWAKGTLGSCAGWAYWAVRWCPRRVSKLCVLFSHCQESWAFFFFFISSAGKGTIDFCSSILQEPGHASPLPEYSSAWQRISHYLVSRRENAAHRVIISAILSASISYS